MELFYGVALSLHLGLPGTYNFIHPEVGVEWENFTLGAYYNSERNVSTYLSYTVELATDVNIQVGLVTGYDPHPSPMIRFNYDDFFIMPASDQGQYGIVLGIELRN